VTRPLVGVTIGIDHRRAGHFSLREDYVRAVEAAGGLPVVLAPGVPQDTEELVGRIQGLVLSGGADVDPAHYGQATHEAVKDVTPARDAFELALCREALRRDLPTLAICRGQQVLNVALGGTLIQDIPSCVSGAADHDPERERWELAHDVRILPGSKLRQILGEDRVAVNSFHHQAVKDLGEGLVASAWSVADDVIEGIEAPARRFAVGVQWHPESFWNRPPGFQGLFEALVAEARGSSGR
jgi:putative glutamine amidotransferase